jgi:hypothetical protein
MEMRAAEALVWRLFGLAIGIGTIAAGGRSFQEGVVTIFSGSELGAGVASARTGLGLGLGPVFAGTTGIVL